MSKEKKQAADSVAKRDKLPVWYPLAWSTRGVSMSLNVIFVGYITFYCTDMLGMAASVVGMLLLASKIFDGVTDLLVGFVIEKTHTRWGKGRPYELFVLLMWLFTILLFTVPDMGRTAQYVYVFIMYLLVNSICATFVNGCEAVYLVRALPTQDKQIKTMSVNGALVMLIAIVFNVIFPQMLNTMGTTKGGWTQMAIMLGIPLGIIGLGRFAFCKEVVSEETVEKEKKQTLSFKEMLVLIVKNKYIWILFGIVLIVNFINNMSMITTYYFKYIVGNIGLQSIASLAGAFTPFLLIFFPILTKKFGTTNVLRMGMVMGIVGTVIRTVGGTNMGTILAGTAIFGIGIMPITLMLSAYVIDTMEYGEWKNGKRVEGPLNSMTSFAIKLGSGIASGATGLIMGLAGYDGVAEVQSKSALNAIVILYNWLPLVLFIVALVLAMMWKLDNLMPQIRADLEARKAKD